MEARVLRETLFPPTCAMLASICVLGTALVLMWSYAGELM